MPIYDYRCGGCQREFEVLVRSDDEAICPECGSRQLEKLVSRPAERDRRSQNSRCIPP